MRWLVIRGKRAFLANFLFRTKSDLAFRHFEPKSLVIFNYHRVRSGDLGHSVFDEDLYGPDQEGLREQFKYLKQNSDVISEQDLLEHVRGRRRLPKSSVMVTFDDGYRDHADLALPVIREQKIPATFFIPTRAIDAREIGWWDQIAFLIKKTKQTHFTLRNRVFDFSSGKKSVIAELQKWMRVLKEEQTRSLIEEISRACEVALPDADACSNELMSWDQVREASKSGVTIGSHTHSHRVLSTLSLSDQFQELRVSKEILERELNRSIFSIAYPVGSTRDYHIETENLAKMSGYELAFSFHTGANRLDRINPFSVARVSPEDSIPLTCATIHLPSIFARSRCQVGPCHIGQ